MHILLKIFLSSVLPILIYFGILRFGIDYSASYKAGLNYWLDPHIFDVLGWLIASLHVNEIPVGAFSIAFLLSYAVLTLSWSMTEYQKIGTAVAVYSISMLFIFSWSVYQPATNTLRQGLMMAMLYFILSDIYQEKKIRFRSTILMLVALFTHKSAVLIIIWILFSRLVHGPKSKIISSFLIGMVPPVYLTSSYERDTIIIGMDITFVLVSFSSVFIICAVLFEKYKSILFSASYLSFIFPFYLFGLYYEYDRLFMIIFVPLLIDLANVFKQKKVFLMLTGFLASGLSYSVGVIH